MVCSKRFNGIHGTGKPARPLLTFLRLVYTPKIAYTKTFIRFTSCSITRTFSPLASTLCIRYGTSKPYKLATMETEGCDTNACR